MLVKNQKIFENKIDIAVSPIAVLCFCGRMLHFSSNLEFDSISGAIYDIASGKVILMEQKKIDQIFSEVEKDRSRSIKEFAD